MRHEEVDYRGLADSGDDRGGVGGPEGETVLV
jgi:hypothetical protein